MARWIPYVLFPRVGWFILHGVAISALFLLGYSVKF